MTGIPVIELIGFFASIKELAPLFEPLFRKGLTELYVDSLENILEQESPFLEGQIFFEKEKFTKELSYKSIDLRKLPIQPEHLTAEIGGKITELLLDNQIIYGVEVDEHWAIKIVNALHNSYYKSVFSKLPIDCATFFL